MPKPPSFPPGRVEWASWRRLLTRTAPWRGVVRAVIRRHGLPPGRILRTTIGTCATFEVRPAGGGPYIVKVFPPMVAGDADREFAALSWLAGALPVRVPRVLAGGYLFYRLDWPYLVLERLPGRPWREVRKLASPRDRARMARKLGSALAALHRARPPKASFGPWGRFVRRRLEALRRDPDLARFTPLAAPLGRLPGRILLHADATADHVMMERRGGRWLMTGLIDFADARLGHPVYELPAVWLDALDRDRRLLEEFLAGYGNGRRGRESAWREHAAGACLLHEFASRDLPRLARERGVSLPSVSPSAFRDWLFPPS